MKIKQATRRTPNGRTLRRWYVTLQTGQVLVRWSEGRWGVHASMRDYGGLYHIEPAPADGLRDYDPAVDETLDAPLR